MPRKRNAVPSYLHHKPTGQGFLKIGRRFIYCGPYDTPESKAEYHRIVAAWETAGRPIEFSPPERADDREPLTMAELMAAYWRHCQAYYVKGGAPTAEQDCVKSALRHINALFADTPAEDFGPLKLKEVQRSMIEAGLSRIYINKQTSRIRQMIKWAVSEEMIPVEVSLALQTVTGIAKGKTKAREPQRVLPVSDEIIDATLEELDDTLVAMVQLQRFTAMRPGEICQLRPCDIDRSHDVWLYLPVSHKNEHHDLNRIVAIGPRAQEVLAPYLLRPAESYCFNPPRSHRDHYTTEAYRGRIEKACRRAFRAPKGLSKAEKQAWDKAHRWKPNQVRHQAATVIRREFDLETVRTVLGHTTVGMSEVYAELDVQRAMEVARRVG